MGKINFIQNLLLFILQKQPIDSRSMVETNVKTSKNMSIRARHLSCHGGMRNVECNSTLRPIVSTVLWLEVEHSAY